MINSASGDVGEVESVVGLGEVEGDQFSLELNSGAVLICYLPQVYYHLSGRLRSEDGV